MPPTTHKLRSQEWFADPAYYGFARRAWLRSEGFTADVFQNKPVIGICNSWSELNNCNVHLRTVAEAVKRGVWTAGGFPLEFPGYNSTEAGKEHFRRGGAARMFASSGARWDRALWQAYRSLPGKECAGSCAQPGQGQSTARRW